MRLFIYLLIIINLFYTLIYLAICSCECGIDVAQSRIFLGREALPNKYPWMVHIRFKISQYDPRYIKCGGSLIDNRHVMTAAHCIFDEFGMLRKKGLAEVYLGLHFLNNLENKYGVEKFIYDKRFNMNGKLDHDFAILRLSKNVQFNQQIYPICIPKTDLDEFDRLVVAGWGKLSTIEGFSNVLNEVEVEHIDRNKCNKLNYDFTLKSQGLVEIYVGEYLNLLNPIHESHMCAIDTVTGAGACVGDSGGPLMYKNPDNNRWYAIGIVSGGYGICGNVHVPTLYTIVTKYKRFIKKYATGSKICSL